MSENIIKNKLRNANLKWKKLLKYLKKQPKTSTIRTLISLMQKWDEEYPSKYIICLGENGEEAA